MKELRGKTIAIASDHAGFDKKQVIIRFFNENNISYKDLGCYSNESCDYPDFAHRIGDAIDKGEYEIGITFCGSGQGINITANKHQNVRSALCWKPEIGALAKQHNDANICAIPARFVTDEEAVEIVKAFLNAEFEGGRHARRIEKIPLKK
ncbi:ribose 5-phosphate isomerase B [Mariniphaga anaerophila]|uniref:Ribose 5-phosphate isomerase B n=1 Tax=Mariniphaga anaerophila TaxID=1484053 RepID=A0A1M5EKR7_9BACT|nr:RpiB/LacA/LacB family sugar-phosphate isomerase [Mariniphaga anaerophila]SHF79661.1 ribose 5-phosphate isomerase B [Mariniphaga anaerophila]